MKRRRQWPPWWEWELEFIGHTHDSMEKRSFTEIDLRRMMEHARTYRRDIVEGRWVIGTRHQRRRWEVIVEPIPERKVLDVITAYALWED